MSCNPSAGGGLAFWLVKKTGTPLYNYAKCSKFLYFSITLNEKKTHYLRRLYTEDETSGGLSGIGITDREKTLFLALAITTNHHSKASSYN